MVKSAFAAGTAPTGFGYSWFFFASMTMLNWPTGSILPLRVRAKVSYFAAACPSRSRMFFAVEEDKQFRLVLRQHFLRDDIDGRLVHMPVLGLIDASQK